MFAQSKSIIASKSALSNLFDGDEIILEASIAPVNSITTTKIIY